MAQLTEQTISAKVSRTMAERYNAVRKFTVSLTETLTEEDCCAQSMPDASPVKWHLAHTTWFFETFILEKFEEGFKPFHPAFRMLFNSYYNGVGEKHVRAQRGLLTRPSFDEVLAYRHHVDARIGNLLADHEKAGAIQPLAELGLQHEQQHQELMLTDIKHLLFMNPLKPAFAKAKATEKSIGIPLEWNKFDAGIVNIGHIGHEEAGFCFDNEIPRHRQFVEPFSLASRLVTNAEYLEFIQGGGYRKPDLWLSEGWDWVNANHLSHPLYWLPLDEHPGQWQEFTLYGLQPLNSYAPVAHLSYFEADAFARWAGARLPSEAEWEHAASAFKEEERHCLHPKCAVNGKAGLQQLFNACWQWTSSSYAPYPGYRPAAGAIGEYNGKFMVNQYVLRGSSCVTPVGHARLTYRNFFPATARWQFSGLRLARSEMKQA